MNDGLRTDMFVRYKPETIACACIFLAARVCQVPLPMEPNSWWELFDADQEQIIDICNMLLQLYSRPKSQSWGKLERTVAALREKQQEKEKSKVKQDGSGADNTPNPHSGDGEKFSPSQSRGASPGERKEGRMKKEIRDSERINGEAGREGRRSRSRSPSYHRKDLPKRYSSGLNERKKERDQKRRHRSRSLSPVRPTPTDFRLRNAEQDLGIVKVRRKSRSRSRDRARKATKEREREVRRTLGKRKRSSTSPETEKRPSKPRK